MKIHDIINLIEKNPISYDNIKNKSIKNLSNTDRFINVIVGVRGRNRFVFPCINYLKKAIGTNPIIITIVEQDTTPNYRYISKTLGVDYIFVDNSTIPHGDQYNRSLCFNIGFLSVKESPWYVFHDIDILVEDTFFEKIKIYIERDPLWLQPYTKKRVLLLKPEITNTLFNNVLDLSKLTVSKDYEEAYPGSTGGSIVVRRYVFIDVGGFDPELFYGYGPEDSFFWSKLEAFKNEIGPMSYHFAGGGMFANNPPIEVYHMFHNTLCNTNPNIGLMEDARKAFWKGSYEGKLEIIEKKRDLLKKCL